MHSTFDFTMREKVDDTVKKENKWKYLIDHKRHRSNYWFWHKNAANRRVNQSRAAHLFYSSTIRPNGYIKKSGCQKSFSIAVTYQ